MIATHVWTLDRKYCPDATLVSPCTCLSENNNQYVTISCGGADHIDMAGVFGRLSKTLHEKHVNKFRLNNTAITELRANTFGAVTFAEIEISSTSSLRHIDSNAFGVNNETVSVVMYYTPKLIQSKDGSIFAMLSKFTNIVTIDLNDNNITEIPDEAFEPLNGDLDQLRWLKIQSNPITRLGNNAFQHLDNVIELSLRGSHISHIPENAFHFKTRSNLYLPIELYDCPNLTSASFAPNSLSHMGRPAALFFGNHNPEKQMSYLDEAVFEPFFAYDPHNKVNLYDVQFDCNDCRNYWLLKYMERLVQTKCADGREVDDKTNFANCKPFMASNE